MDNKHFVGKRVSSLETYNAIGPITGVALVVDENNEYQAGNDSGYVMEIECPYGTQAMADALLASLSGNIYRGYRADAAELALEAELGDGITVGGVYSMLAYRSVGFGPGHMSEIVAPGENELEHEYSYKSQAERQIERKIATTRSMITKTAEDIRLEVSKELEGLSSSIDIKLDGITSTVSDSVKNLQSQIDQKVGSVSLSVSNGTSSSTITLTVDGVQVASKKIQFTGDVVFASDLTDGETTISGDNILTGSISAERIKLGGEMNVYEGLSDDAELGGYFGYVQGEDYNGNTTYGLGMQNGSNWRNQIVATSGGTRMSAYTNSSNRSEIVAGYHITLETDNNVNMTAAGAFINNSEIATSSDRNKKENIIYGVEDYLPLFDKLRPCSFRYIGRNRQHLGMIAQDVEASLAELGIETVNFAPLINNEGEYSLRYGEFIPLLIAKVQQLEKRLEALSV